MNIYTYDDYKKSADYIRTQIGDFKPEFLMILGSGLGFLGDLVENPRIVPYDNIHGFRVSTAPDHKGQFVFGTLSGKNVAVMQGRLHGYEGYCQEELTYPVRVAKLLGINSLIITNASGCVNEGYNKGDLMLITDHIKLFGDSPLQGKNIPEFGPRFNDMSHCYTPEYQEIAKKVAKELDFTLRTGVYMVFPGPQFETPAEVRLARILGADAVGMSTVPEVIIATHCGMKVLGLSLLTNMAAGILNQELSSEEVNETAKEKEKPLAEFVLKALENL